jgi:hypothetical protein
MPYTSEQFVPHLNIDTTRVCFRVAPRACLYVLLRRRGSMIRALVSKFREASRDMAPYGRLHRIATSDEWDKIHPILTKLSPHTLTLPDLSMVVPVGVSPTHSDYAIVPVTPPPKQRCSSFMSDTSISTPCSQSIVKLQDTMHAYVCPVVCAHVCLVMLLDFLFVPSERPHTMTDMLRTDRQFRNKPAHTCTFTATVHPVLPISRNHLNHQHSPNHSLAVV